MDSEAYEDQLSYAVKNHIQPGDLMICLPVSFAAQGKLMLNNLQTLISDHDLVILRKFEALIMDLRIARVNENTGNLQKNNTSGSTFDLLDGLRLSCSNYIKTARLDEDK